MRYLYEILSRLVSEDTVSHKSSSAAMQLLAETGGSRITIDSLVARLGVTKGSFYWHFQDRAEFIRSLVDYWDRRYTRVVTETLGESTAPASIAAFARYTIDTSGEDHREPACRELHVPLLHERAQQHRHPSESGYS